MLPIIGPLRPWADPDTVSIGRLGMRPPTVAFPTAADSRAATDGSTGGFASTRWRRRLDGRWHFRLFDAPDLVPASALTRPVGSRQWTRVVVPGNWTLQGVGDHPHYTNVSMPFDGPPPALPERNPTGVYRRAFDVPAAWADRQVVLHVGGAESVHAVYVNGAFAGYGTDSRLASEYDVTDHVHAGSNELAIVVIRWSAQSYVEDQDQWWMAGLHREVFVEARAMTHLGALVCDAGFVPVVSEAAGAAGATDAGRPERGVGTLAVRAELGGPVPPGRGW